MRRYLAFAFALIPAFILAGCATAPNQPVSAAAPPPPVPPGARQLQGLTPQELVGHFGHPALQISEGTSMKLQFRSRRCVLDAYLYPSGNTRVLRVTHVDTRTRAGTPTDQASCILDLENPS